MTGTVEYLLDAYVAAWNERDGVARAALLDQAVADDFLFEGPTGRFKGRHAVDELIAALQERMPGALVVRTGPIAATEPVRFPWEIRRESGERLLGGTDVAEIGEDGRLRRIAMEGWGS